MEIKGDTFIRGESSSPDLSDGGFSSESYGLNLTKTRGMLQFAESPTEMAGATLTGNIIARAKDGNSLGNDAYFLDDGGAVYTLDGSTFTKRQTTSGTFQLGTSDLRQFNLVTYATSQDSLHEFTGEDLATSQRLWGGAFNTLYRHPMEIVEDELFIADGNVIYYLNNAGTTGTAFTLPVGKNVTTMRKAPDGRTLLAFTGERIDFSHVVGQSGNVYYCNPIIRDWEREVSLPAQVEGSITSNGITFCTWGKNFGYFNGSGLVPLKRFDTSATTFSHSMENMEDILLVRDGTYVLAYGNLGAGNVWWRPHKESTSNINVLAYKGDNVLLVGNAGADLNQIDYDNAGVNGVFRTNRMTFGSEVVIRRLDLIHDNTTANSSQAFFFERLQDGTENTIEDRTWTTATRFTRIAANIKTDMFQFGITPSSGAIGYRYIRIGYEPIK